MPLVAVGTIGAARFRPPIGRLGERYSSHIPLMAYTFNSLVYSALILFISPLLFFSFFLFEGDHLHVDPFECIRAALSTPRKKKKRNFSHFASHHHHQPRQEFFFHLLNSTYFLMSPGIISSIPIGSSSCRSPSSPMYTRWDSFHLAHHQPTSHRVFLID